MLAYDLMVLQVSCLPMDLYQHQAEKNMQSEKQCLKMELLMQ